MPGKVSLTTLGRWDKQIGVPLGDALAVSMDVTGRTGEEACQHAIILMAQSAAARTRVAKKLRKVVKNPDDRWKTDGRRAPFGVMRYSKGKRVFRPIFRTGEYGKQRFFDKRSMAFFTHTGPNKNTWTKMASGADIANPSIVVPGIMTDKRRKIGRRGLAKSSWLWGLSRLKARGRLLQKEIPGVTNVARYTAQNLNGYVLTNRLRYITANGVMAPGWEAAVAIAATNKIMAQARNKLEAKWRREMGMPRRARNAPHSDNASIARYFLKGVKA